MALKFEILFKSGRKKKSLKGDSALREILKKADKMAEAVKGQ